MRRYVGMRSVFYRCLLIAMGSVVIGEAIAMNT